MGWDLPIVRVKDEKELKNTGTEQRPFWSKIGTTRRVYFLIFLVFKHTTSGNFPDPDKE